MEYYSVIKKNEIMPLAATWMDLEIIILSKVSQTEKDKYHMILKRRIEWWLPGAGSGGNEKMSLKRYTFADRR